MSYDAFISYNHKADIELARALEDGLKRFARPWNRIRAKKVFRDEHSLAANARLWGSIEAPLSSSAFLILLASPGSAQSTWCNREVETFLANKPIDKVLLVVTDGDIKWDAAAEFESGATNCLPPALRLAFTEQPHYINARALRTSGKLSLRNPDFANFVADIASPIHGVPKDDLFGKEIREHRRFVLLRNAAIAGLATLTLLAIGLGTLANQKRQEAIAARNDAVVSEKTAVAARNDAVVAQLTAEAERARAVVSEKTAVAARNDAVVAQRTAEAEKVRAVRSLFSSLTLYLVGGQPGSVCVRPLCPGAPAGDGRDWISISRLPPELRNLAKPPEISRDFVVAREYGQGHVLVYAHDGLTRDDEIQKGGDNLVFAENALRWLAPTSTPAGCAPVTTILFWPGTYLQVHEIPAVRAFIQKRNWSLVVAKPETLEADLRCAAVFWYASDWFPPKDFAARHVPLIERFVRDGGGLLVGGLGWSYAAFPPCPAANQPCTSGEPYAANELGKPFGFAFTLDLFQIDANQPIPLLRSR